MSDDKEWRKKQREYEQKKARTKLALNVCTICGKKGGRPCKGCGTVAYCSTECQRIDWRDRGHRKACKKIQDERTAEAARAEARAESPPPEVFYGPAPRSHADEVRARIAAEHEAARVRREANPEWEPLSARWGSRCPICLEEWDVNTPGLLRLCCCRTVCQSCEDKISTNACPLCRIPCAKSEAEHLARLRRHVENEVPEAIASLGTAYRLGRLGLVKSDKKAAKIYRRAVELGDVDAMAFLGELYQYGEGVKLDKKKAERLYRAAADRGEAVAQTNLGAVLHSEKKFDEAFPYFALAADQGLTAAENNLACCYRDGTGAEVDLGKARYWFERAAAKGHERAIETLARLDARLAALDAQV